MVSRFTLPAKVDPHLSVLQPEATTARPVSVPCATA